MVFWSSVPKGLEDVSKYPALFAELLRRGYSDNDVAKISRLNIIRVLQEAEEVCDTLGFPHKMLYIAHCTFALLIQVSDKLQLEGPDNTLISPQPNQTCRPDF